MYNPKHKDYEFVNKIGEGAQGTVWKAIRVSDGKKIAIKILLAYNEPSKKVAIEEVEKLKTLSIPRCHPNVICYYGYNTDEDHIYMEMEYIEGETLNQYAMKLRNNGEYEKLYRHLLLITKDLSEGLLYIHDRNILHNDIKPNNIMITTEGKIPILVDFGVACHSHSLCYLNTDQVKCCRGMKGTYEYMPPETYTDEEFRYPRSDVWALGVTLYEMATGELPFNLSKNYNVLDIIKAIIDDTPKILNTSNKLLNTIVNRALVKNPADRIITLEIYDLLKNYQ